MWKVKFVRNETMEEYHSAYVDFDTFGQEDEVPESIAKRMKAKFPNMFRIYGDDGKEIKKVDRPERPRFTARSDEPMITLQFRAHGPLDEYHGLADFEKTGETQDVPKSIAEKLLEKFPKNFRSVLKQPKPDFVEVEDLPEPESNEGEEDWDEDTDDWDELDEDFEISNVVLQEDASEEQIEDLGSLIDKVKNGEE